MRRGVSHIPRVERRRTKNGIMNRGERSVASLPVQSKASQEKKDSPLNIETGESMVSLQESKVQKSSPFSPPPSLPNIEMNTEEQQQGFHAIPAEPEWKASVDWKTNRKYYYNLLTKEVQWEKPKGFDERKLAYKEAIKKYRWGSLDGPGTAKKQSKSKNKQAKKLSNFWKQDKSQRSTPANNMADSKAENTADKYSTLQDIQSMADKYATMRDIQAITTQNQDLVLNKQIRRKRFPFFVRRNTRERIRGNCNPQAVLGESFSPNLSFCGVNSFLPEETAPTDPPATPIATDEAEWDKGFVINALSSRSVHDTDSVTTADSYDPQPSICGVNMQSSTARDPPPLPDTGNSSIVSSSFEFLNLNTFFCGLGSNLPKIGFRSPVVIASFDSRDDETYTTLSRSMSQTTMSQTTMSERDSTQDSKFSSEVDKAYPMQSPGRYGHI